MNDIRNGTAIQVSFCERIPCVAAALEQELERWRAEQEPKKGNGKKKNGDNK